MNLKTIFISVLCMTWMACITEDSKEKTGPVLPGTPTEKPDSASLTTIKWIDSVKNMGSVLEGKQVEVFYRFINTGAKPLVIANARPSCGCTVPEKPDAPIMPGQEGLIKAIFNSEGRTGTNHKTITVDANTSPSPSHVLEFNVTVLGKADGPKAANSTDESNHQF